jgi:hypothetical protein
MIIPSAMKKVSQTSGLKEADFPAFYALLSWVWKKTECRLEPWLRGIAIKLQTWDKGLEAPWRKLTYMLLLLLFALLIYLPSWIPSKTARAKAVSSLLMAPISPIDPLIAPDTLLIHLSLKPTCYEE